MNQNDELLDLIAKAIADHIGHGMREKCCGHAQAVITALAKFQADHAKEATP